MTTVPLVPSIQTLAWARNILRWCLLFPSLVPTIQIQACTPPPFILRWCLLLFPWYWPFKFKHAYTRQNFFVSVFCSLGMVDWQCWCLLFLWYHTEHSSLHLSWCTTMGQPKSQRINITIKINCIFATTLNTDMLSKNHIKSHPVSPVKKVGFFCYWCGCDDFGLNKIYLSAHVQYCSFDPYSTSLTKRKSDHLSSSLHSSGSSPYPLLVKKTCSLNNNTINTADLYLNTSNDINVDVTAEEGCADGYLEDYNLPIHDYSIHTDTSLQDTVFIGTNVIDHSIIPSTEDSAIPYDPNCVIPLSYCFHLDLIQALSNHRINLNVHDEIIQAFIWLQVKLFIIQSHEPNAIFE